MSLLMILSHFIDHFYNILGHQNSGSGNQYKIMQMRDLEFTQKIENLTPCEYTTHSSNNLPPVIGGFPE